MHEIGQSGRFLGRLLGPLLKTGLSLTKNVLKPLAKSVLLTAAASATDAAIQKKIFESGTTALIISNEELNNIMKIVKSFEGSGLLKKVSVKQLQMKQKSKKAHFLVCY